MSDWQVIEGDCLEIMNNIPDGSVDMILCDLPYGSTRNSWDVVIPLAPLWQQYQRIIKQGGAIVLFGNQPFTSLLVTSNLEWFKYEDVWHKSQATGHLNALVMPMREHENVLVFGKGRITYNPQITPKRPENIRPNGRRAPSDCYGSFGEYAIRSIPADQTYPRSVIQINNTNHGERGLHPTQKPVALLEYLIRTYTNEGELVLDNTCGSGSTGEACIKTDRRFIGIESKPEYVQVARQRLARVAAMPRQATMDLGRVA